MIIYWYFFIMGIAALILAILFLAVLRPTISPLRFAVRSAYNFGLGLVIAGLLLLISAMILELVLS